MHATQKRIDVMGAEVGYFHYVNKGVDWVFVDHPSYPRPGGLYADEHGVYGDNQVGPQVADRVGGTGGISSGGMCRVGGSVWVALWAPIQRQRWVGTANTDSIRH